VYYINDKTNQLNVTYGLQTITLPMGTWHLKTKPIRAEYQYYEDGETKVKTSYYLDKDGNEFAVCLDYSFGVSHFPEGVYFQDSDESYLYRLTNEKVLLPTSDEKLLEGYREVEIFRSEETYCKGKDDEYILIVDGKLRTIWQYSGKEDYPLGQLLWAEFSSPRSIQYLGNSRAVESEPCLIWSYNAATAR